MSTQDDDRQGPLWPALLGVVALAAALVTGIGIYHPEGAAAATQAAPVMGAVPPVGAAASAPVTSVPVTSVPVASAPAASAAPPSVGAPAGLAEGASVAADGGVVRFYFASGSAELAAGAKEALSQVVMGVATGKKAIISVYRDAASDAAQNDELTRQRARAVHDTLTSLGIGEDKIETRDPEAVTAPAASAGARRVEVRLE